MNYFSSSELQTAMTALSLPETHLSGSNWYTYLRLKQALSLNLRRQVLIAVCDDLNLRDKLAESLQIDLATLQDEISSSTSALLPQQPSVISPFPNSAPKTSGARPSQPAALNRPLNSRVQLVGLELNLRDPNPIEQIEQWMSRNTVSFLQRSALGFQILGVEQLTRQSPSVQWTFLRHLRNLEDHLMTLEASLLLWVPSPWLCCIQQSAMEFWQWRTGVFQFAGDPTPPGQRSIPATGVASQIAVVELPPEPPAESTQLPQPKPLLQQIKRLTHQGISGMELALVYNKLGDLYRDRIQVGDGTAATLEQGIQAYEQTLEQLEQSSTPVPASLSLPDLLNDLGMLYWMQYCQQVPGAPLNTEAVTYLERSIIFYQKALMILNPEEHLESYVRLYRNLGTAYGDLARVREPMANLEQSVSAYQEALRYSQIQAPQSQAPQSQTPKPKITPVEVGKTSSTQCLLQVAQFVALCNNLGTAHWNLAQQTDGVYHLNAAISAYSEALKVIAPEQDPLHYAMLQTNLGTAYWNLAQHQPSESLLLQAVKAYRSALKYRTVKDDPIASATVYNNLGIAYWHLAQLHQHSESGDRYLKGATAAYENALKLTQDSDPTQLAFERAAAHNNLGMAYYQLGTNAQGTASASDRMTHLKSALHHHIQAEHLDGEQSHPTQGDYDHHPTYLSYMVRTIRAFYREAGVSGQNQALSQIPGHLLPEILKSL
ncbi:MAG: tetratricopeptide repeat protein [Oscillatoriales cyanobacterium RM2_1_1]|nr:tetratricopeptide repeat protein [Oscillatoriales cyanobacterium SM2_3_0]NJO47440.1 tetratricopeptide repeat protein [Oscillatoriales cyanobacterium RM2_1_1]